MRTFVVIESPYAGDVGENMRYLDRCVMDCLRRGETPYASHRMLTTALDDRDEAQRGLGIAAGLDVARGTRAPVVFYMDRGVSDGMARSLRHHVMHHEGGIFMRWLSDGREVQIKPRSAGTLHGPQRAADESEEA